MTTSSPFGTPIWNWLINPLPKWEGWFPSLFFCCTVQAGLHARSCRTTYRYSLDFFIFFRVRTRSTLPNFFALFVPLFCRLLTYEGTLMLPSFEMLVRSPILLLLPYAQGSWWPKLSEYEFHLFLYATRRAYAGQKCVVLLTPFAYLVQCLKRVSFFRLSFLFFLHIFPLPTYKRCRRCSNSSILLLDGLFSP